MVRRAVGIALVMTLAGCSKSPSNNDNAAVNNSAADVGDMAVIDTGSDAGPQPDVTYSDYCDFSTPCENPAEVCAFVIEDEFAAGAFECRPVLGNKQQGEPCDRPNDLLGEDDCAAGLFCHAFGQGPATCKPMCDSSSSSTCDDLGVVGCVPVTRFAAIGVCVPECDLEGTDCADGEKCGRWEGFNVCDLDGGAAIGDPCTDSNDCSVLQVCTGADGAGKTCERTCDDDIACPGAGGCTQGEAGLQFPHCVDLDWSCVGSVTYPAPAGAEGMVTIVVGPENDVESGTIKACAADDATCAAPLDEQSIDGSRAATLTVPLGATGFDGYFEITASFGDPLLYYPPAPITEPAAAFEVRMRTRVSEWINDAVLDPMRGELQATVRDCAGRVASGVSVTGANDPSVEVGYDSFRYVDRIHRDRTSTGPGGRAGVLNHPTGSQTFTFRRSDGTVVATRQVLIRANMTTMVDVSPTP